MPTINYEKSYRLYLEKIEKTKMREVTLENGKTKKVGIKYLEPRSYSEFVQIYPIIKDYTGGKNVLREIVVQSRETSIAQAKAAWKIQSRLNKMKFKEGETRPPRYTRGDINRLSREEIREIFAQEYSNKEFQEYKKQRAAAAEEEEENEAWKEWKILRGISP